MRQLLGVKGNFLSNAVGGVNRTILWLELVTSDGIVPQLSLRFKKNDLLAEAMIVDI